MTSLKQLYNQKNETALKVYNRKRKIALTKQSSLTAKLYNDAVTECDKISKQYHLIKDRDLCRGFKGPIWSKLEQELQQTRKDSVDTIAEAWKEYLAAELSAWREYRSKGGQ